MKATVRAWSLALLVVATAACGDAAGLAPPEGVYTGTVTARIIEPDAAPGRPESGTGSARFEAAGQGRDRLRVKASIRESGDAGFEMTGLADGSGWRGGTGALALVIGPDGKISGGGVENNHRISFDGRATASHMDLTVETLKLGPTPEGGLPPGTRIVFDYDLARAGSTAGAGAGSARSGGTDSAAKGKCKRRVWRVRNVTTPGGGMTMVRVPHCVN